MKTSALKIGIVLCLTAGLGVLAVTAYASDTNSANANSQSPGLKTRSINAVHQTQDGMNKLATKLKSDGREIGEKSRDFGLTVADKSKDFGLTVADKSKEIGLKVADKSKDFGHAVADKSKEIAGKVKDKFEQLTN